MPPLDVVEEHFRTYFYATEKGMEVHEADDACWPFELPVSRLSRPVTHLDSMEPPWLQSVAQQERAGGGHLQMKFRLAVEMLAIAACAAVFTPVVSKASHPPVFPSMVSTKRTAQSIVNPSGTGQYQFTTIDVPGTSDTEAYGVNNAGVVSGFYVLNGIGHGFLWQNGVFLAVVQSPGPNTLFGDVNEPGMVVGNYGPSNAQHAALYSIRTGMYTTFPDVPNLPINVGNGINPQGIATGSAAMGNLALPSNSVGWTWDGRNYSFFSVPGAAGFGTESIGINAPGSVSGFFQDVNGSFHGFLKEGSKFTHIDVPGASDTLAYGLNNSGEQVGYYVDQQSNTHGFVLRAGNFTTIDVPGSLATLVTNINEPGDLVGLWFDSNATHAFLATRR